MIVSRLQGGLGNQLFQYAAGRALALRTGASLSLDTSLLERDIPALTPRIFELWPYRLDYRRLSKAEQIWLRLDIRYGHRGPLRWLPSHWGGRYCESHFHYDPRLLTRSDPVVLEGYWQSPRYFEGLEQELRTAIRDDYAASGDAMRIAGAMSTTSSISVHVRRGDYLANANAAERHALCTEAYDVAAAERLGKHVVDPVFFVFSDDPQWVQQHYTFPGRTVHVSGQSGLSHHDELYLMSHCKHHIIANSAFSWWGAWLNPAPNKMVIAPSPWFNDPETKVRDLLPADWTIVSS